MRKVQALSVPGNTSYDGPLGPILPFDRWCLLLVERERVRATSSFETKARGGVVYRKRLCVRAGDYIAE